VHFIVDGFLIFDDDGKDRVGARGLGIHFGMGDFPVTLPVVIFVMKLIPIFNHKLRKTHDFDPFVRAFVYFKLLLLLSLLQFLWLRKQIDQLFVI